MVMSNDTLKYVLIILDKGCDSEVMLHTEKVFDDLEIPYETLQLNGDENDPDLIAYIDDAIERGLGMIVVGTFYAYTDENFPKFPDIHVPILKVITGPIPSSLDKMAINIGTTGFGIDGAVNAGLFVARVFALGDLNLLARLQGYRTN